MRRLRPALLTAFILVAPLLHAEDVVRLGNLKLAHFGAISYIKEIAPQCGIKVEERLFAKGPDIMQAMIAGELDVGASASEAAISGRANGVPIVVVAGFARGGARLVGRSDLNLNSIESLRSRRVGVTRGGIQEVLLAAELAQHHLSWSDQPGKDVQVIYLAYPDLNQALMQKNVDAIMQSEPYSSQAIAQGWGKEIMKPYDTPIGEPVRTLVMTEAFYARRPLAQKFMQCFVRATKAFIDNPKLAETYVTGTLFKHQLTPAEFRAAMANSPYSYDITAEHLQRTADTMFKYGIGKMRAPPVARDFVKTDLLESAKHSLGIQP
ncbi:MAG: ABC transporter substrate-binding protein [Betaproteobacteria bacterium]|nr:ABC transporter substrate-binding protein [Betaproteobacteria bacterium]MDE2131176.1 ABC transporter substrate-binding protein [Betaproteobacteria bacterium]MDE2211103.1 ABC transporter substrate-binding protein [Betaproteobacteria bacterium]MDE2624222.1 ABC transporter substrate-binding protein [Betaproteobacteria bacterium]